MRSGTRLLHGGKVARVRHLELSHHAVAQLAQQRQELAALREQELPQLRGELERAQQQARDLQAKQDDLRQRAAQIEQQTKKLEQLETKLESDSTTRYAWIQKSLETQDVKNKEDRDQLRMELNARLDDVNKQMEVLRKDIIEAVQKTNSALTKNVDARLEEQHNRLDSLDVVIGTILLRIEKLEKRLKPLKKR